MANKTMSPTKVVIPCRLSFANIWEPKSINGGEEKYSVSCIIPKADKATLAKIQKAIEAAKEDAKGKKWGGKIPPNLKLPLRDGDIDRPDDENYADCMFLNATSKDAPQIVDRKVQPILDPMDCGSGDYANVSVNFYGFSASGNRGIAAGLGNIQKVRTGERLAGKTSAASDFDEIEGEDDGTDVFGEDHPSELQKPIAWKQGWAEESIRSKSSSGGFGTALLTSFVDENSYVAACRFKDGRFSFDFTNDLSELSQFTGSKYVKSNPRGIYRKVKDKLKEGNRVLFIGLPCQVSAMKNFVGDRLSEDLYTVDLICHGSPSPRLLENSMKGYGYDLKQVKNIYFRNNTSFGLRTDLKKVVPSGVQDRYTMAFLRCLCYTENCYSCHYAQGERVGDLTIGDSWGTELEKEMEEGVSLALCQTQKGIELLNNAGLELKDVDLENAIVNNRQLNAPSKKPEEREKFFKNLRKTGNFNRAVASVYQKICLKQDVKKTLIELHILKGGVTNNMYQIWIEE